MTKRLPVSPALREPIGPAGGGNIWFVTGDAEKPGTGTLTRISP